MSWRALRSLPPEATVIRAVVAKQHISSDGRLRIGFFVNKEGLSGDLEKFRSLEQVLRFRSRGGDQVSVARFAIAAVRALAPDPIKGTPNVIHDPDKETENFAHCLTVCGSDPKNLGLSVRQARDLHSATRFPVVAEGHRVDDLKP